MTPDQDQLTDTSARESDRLIADVYQTLRLLARQYLRGERGDHTLQPTALVNEAYLRMLRIHHVQYQGKTHFLATAARQMRRVLVDHARSRKRRKRGGELRRVSMHDHHALTPETSCEILAVEEALQRLVQVNPRHARVAELRLFGGLTVVETSQVVGIAERTVKKDWRLARAWIARELGAIGDEAR